MGFKKVEVIDAPSSNYSHESQLILPRRIDLLLRKFTMRAFISVPSQLLLLPVRRLSLWPNLSLR